MLGAFVLANNKDNLNRDGCLWYFGGISSSFTALGVVIKNVLLFLAYYRMDNLYPCHEQRICNVGTMTFQCRHSSSESSKYSSHAYVVKSTKILTEY